MGKNVIVSEETLRDLLEAHASLSAWYYELWAALRAVNASARPPDDATRAAFMGRLAADFPEIAAVVQRIGVPRMFVPPPPVYAPVPRAAADDRPESSPSPEPPTTIEPAPARLRELLASQAPKAGPSQAPAPGAPSSAPAVPPPPLVDPSRVKYSP